MITKATNWRTSHRDDCKLCGRHSLYACRKENNNGSFSWRYKCRNPKCGYREYTFHKRTIDGWEEHGFAMAYERGRILQRIPTLTLEKEDIKRVA